MPQTRAQIKTNIDANITTNGNEEITGAILRSVLNNMADNLATEYAGYQYAGVATPSTNPGTPDGKVFYLASTAGTYTNFGSLTVAEGEVAVLKYNGSAWSKDITGAATKDELNQLGQQVIYYVKEETKSIESIKKYSIGFYDSEISPYYGSNGYMVVLEVNQNILKPKINVAANQNFTFGLYRINNGVYNLIYSQDFTSSIENPVVSGTINHEIAIGDVAAVTYGIGYTRGQHGFKKVELSNNELISSFSDNDILTDTSDLGIFFELYQDSIDVIGVINETVSKEKERAELKENELQNGIYNINNTIDKTIPLDRRYGFYNKEISPNYTSQGYMIVVDVIKDILHPKINVASGGNFYFGIYRYDSTLEYYKLIYEQYFFADSQNPVIGALISHKIEAGDKVAVIAKTSGIGYKLGYGNFNRVGEGLTQLVEHFSDNDISEVTNYGIFFEVYQEAFDINSIDKDIEKMYNDLSLQPNKKIGLIKNTVFNTTTLQDGWENNGYILTQDGASSPDTGDIDNVLQYVQYCDIDASYVTYIIDATARPNILLTRYRRQYPNLGGHVVGVDFVAMKCKIYEATVKGVMPSVVLKEFDIPINTFQSSRIIISVGNFAELERISIFYMGRVFNFYYDARTEILSDGRPHDNYGIVHLGGTYIVKDIMFSSQLALDPDVLIVGDSITEADSIRTEQGGGFENRWAGLLSKITKTSIWAEGGATAGQAVVDLPMLTSLFKPAKVIFALGTNNSDFEAWKNSCIAFTNAFEALGSEVIYVTPMFRPVLESSHSAIRNWIKTSGHRYIDYCAVMTVNGKCEAVNTELVLSDGLHPNVEGHRRIFEEVKTIIPDVCTF